MLRRQVRYSAVHDAPVGGLNAVGVPYSRITLLMGVNERISCWCWLRIRREVYFTRRKSQSFQCSAPCPSLPCCTR